MNDEPLIEATVEMVLIEHPELIKPGLRFIEKREKINGAGIINLVFEDVKLEKRVLVEVKRGTASRQDIGQVVDYFGALRETETEAEIIFVANEIKTSFKIALSMLGVEYREIRIEHRPVVVFQTAGKVSTKKPLDEYLLDWIRRLAVKDYEQKKQTNIDYRGLEVILQEVEEKYGICSCEILEKNGARTVKHPENSLKVANAADFLHEMQKPA
ncbi:TPA: DUF91 domain-containing protein [Candidatus Micrarchaeota archaeon]|nr:DUF91 domain-containing protein [Candidatus Micrarchaeota archaeon]